MKTITISKDKPTNVWLKTFFSILLIALIFGFSSCQDESSNQLAEDYLKGLDLGTLSGTSQNAPVVYFEKRRFTRTSEAPFEEIVRLENPNFEHFSGDFVLKIQNGNDKRTRVSSAEIRVDGILVVDPSDFSKNVTLITKEIFGITPESTIEIKLISSPGSYFDLWVEGTLKPNHALINTMGGLYYFLDNKIKLEIPENAVNSPVFITIEDITADIPDELRTIIMQAIDMKPDGLNFLKPIKMFVTNEIIGTKSSNVFQAITRSNGLYSGVRVLNVDGLKNEINLEILHFSSLFVYYQNWNYLVLDIPGEYLLKSDLLYTFSYYYTYLTGEVLKFNWFPGHVALYLGSKENFTTENDGQTIIESTPDFVRYSTLNGFTEDIAHLFLGARRYIGDISYEQRQQISDFAIKQLDKPWSL